MRYRLRTLLILLAVLPPLLAVGWWNYATWRAERDRRAAEAALKREEDSLRAKQQQLTWLKRLSELEQEQARMKESMRKQREPQEAEPGVYFLGPVND